MSRAVTSHTYSTWTTSILIEIIYMAQRQDKYSDLFGEPVGLLNI